MNPTLQSPTASEEEVVVRNIQNMNCYQDTAPGNGAVKSNDPNLAITRRHCLQTTTTFDRSLALSRY
jgi:hypothetical protein